MINSASLMLDPHLQSCKLFFLLSVTNNNGNKVTALDDFESPKAERYPSLSLSAFCSTTSNSVVSSHYLRRPKNGQNKKGKS